MPAIRPKIVALGAAIVLVGVGGVVAAAAHPKTSVQYRTAAATVATIQQTLSLTGNLTALDETDVSFAVSGTVTGVDVSVGQTVTQGETLATVGSSALEDTLEQAEASLTEAQDKLSVDTETEADGSASSLTQAEEQLTDARTTLSQDQTSLEDTEAQNALTLSDDQAAVTTDQNRVDSDTTALAAAQSAASDASTIAADQQQLTADQSSLTQAQSQLTSDTVKVKQSNDQAQDKVASDDNSVSSAETSVTQAQASEGESETNEASQVTQDTASIAQAEQTVATDRTDVADAALTAPIAGEVVSVGTAVGDSVSSGQSASTGATSASSTSSSSSSADFVILTPGVFEVTADVSDSEIDEVTTGQAATVTPADSTEAYAATVTAVSPLATVTSGVAEYPVTVTLSGLHPSLRDGMSATIGVITEQVVGVLTVPTSAVHTGSSGSTVDIPKKGGEVAVSVTTGAADASRTQIVSGLTAGEEIVISAVSSSIPTTSSSTTTTSLGGGGGFSGGGPGTGFGG